MSEHLSEEEQLEVFKQWWKDNGTSLIVGVLVAVVGYFAWQGWQGSQTTAREQSSLIYDELLEVVSSDPSKPLDEQQTARVESIVDALKTEYGNSTYAQHAALHLAKVAVQTGDLAKAEAELRWVLAEKPDAATADLVNLRLAKVLYAQEKADEALALINGKEDSANAPFLLELRGDIYTDRGEWVEASNAYTSAIEKLDANQAGLREIIEMKLADLPAVATAGDDKEG